VVDSSRIKAVYKDGLLEIRLPKREEAKPRAIPVEGA
jgi:HSP20 family molecular chaperone IbpA